MSVCIHCRTKAPAASDTCPDCGKKYGEKKQCGHCGFSALGSFINDTCPECFLTYWKCGNCGRIEASEREPEKCPGCNEVCDFKNVTCYTPDCGGPGNIDPRL